MRLIGMVGEACLPSDAYFPWTPDYTPFILGPCPSVCLNIPNFAFVYINCIYWPQIHTQGKYGTPGLAFMG